MTREEMLSRIDHTLLKPFSTWEEIQALCSEAIKYKTASVCIPPSYVRAAREAYPGLNICTVIGFPLGYNAAAVKAFEAEQALRDGANEIDMVINIGALKEKRYGYVQSEIEEIKKACGERILKVIVEACYLTDEEKISACEIATAAGADFVKTSTGFGPGGATLEDVALFRRHIGPDVKIKASGGIRALEDLQAFLIAGCERIGASSAVAMLAE